MNDGASLDDFPDFLAEQEAKYLAEEAERARMQRIGEASPNHTDGRVPVDADDSPSEDSPLFEVSSIAPPRSESAEEVALSSSSADSTQDHDHDLAPCLVGLAQRVQDPDLRDALRMLNSATDKVSIVPYTFADGEGKVLGPFGMTFAGPDLWKGLAPRVGSADWVDLVFYREGQKLFDVSVHLRLPENALPSAPSAPALAPPAGEPTLLETLQQIREDDRKRWEAERAADPVYRAGNRYMEMIERRIEREMVEGPSAPFPVPGVAPGGQKSLAEQIREAKEALNELKGLGKLADGDQEKGFLDNLTVDDGLKVLQFLTGGNRNPGDTPAADRGMNLLAESIAGDLKKSGVA